MKKGKEAITFMIIPTRARLADWSCHSPVPSLLRNASKCHSAIEILMRIQIPASYTLACSRNDPKLDECVVKHGQMAIPYFIDGTYESRHARN